MKFKWKKGTINLCTPFNKVHIVNGYVCGMLAIHKIPEIDDVKHGAKDNVWTITQVQTGLGIWARRQPPFRTLAEAKDFAGRLMLSDTWYIEGATFGDGGGDRIKALEKVFADELIREFYFPSMRESDPLANPKEQYVCGTCGEASER